MKIIIIAIFLFSVACLGRAATDESLRRQIRYRQRIIDSKLNTAQNLVRGKVQYAELMSIKMRGKIDLLNNTFPFVTKINNKINEIIRRGQEKNVDVTQCISPLNELKQRAEQIKSDVQKCIEQRRTEEKNMLNNITTISTPFNKELEKIRGDVGKCNETPTDLLQTLTCYSKIQARIDVLMINQFLAVKKELMQLIAEMVYYPKRIFKTCYGEGVFPISSGEILSNLKLVNRCILNESSNSSPVTSTPGYNYVTEIVTYRPGGDDDDSTDNILFTTTPFDEESTTPNPEGDFYGDGSITDIPLTEFSEEVQEPTTPAVDIVEESSTPIAENPKEPVTLAAAKVEVPVTPAAVKIEEIVTQATTKVEMPVTPDAAKVEEPVTPAAEKSGETAAAAATGGDEELPFKIVAEKIGTYETLPEGAPAAAEKAGETAPTAAGEDEELPFKIVAEKVGTYDTLPEGATADEKKTETMDEVPIA